MSRLDEQLTEQFRKWEIRGRGWQVFGEPVSLEPPFRPFHGHYLPDTPLIDDGRKQTFLSSLVDKLSKKLRTSYIPAVIDSEQEEEPEPMSRVRDMMIELQAAMPADLAIAKESFEKFFRNLTLCHEPVAFELIGVHGRVMAQFAACEADISLVRKQLSAHFPDVQFRQQSSTLETKWLASQGDEAFAVEFGLEQEFMVPLATGKLDPFVSIVGAMEELLPGELAMFQVLFQPVQHPWAESILNSVTHADGKPFFINAPELAGAAENKTARPLYAAVVRIMARTDSRERLHEIARELAGSLRVFDDPQSNAIIPLKNDDYPFEEHIVDVLRRQSRRSGMILNSDELINFVHLPSSEVQSPALLRDAGRTKAAPANVRQPPGIVIGDNEHNDDVVPVFLNAEQRVHHTHIIGSSGSGKSSLLFNLIRQDIDNGDGVAVFDPHGDLIDQILTVIPAERIDDVILVNPFDFEFPIGFNILQAHSETEKNLLASDLVSVFRRLSTSWGDQMNTVLQNAILVFLESSRGGTLMDLRRFLLLEQPFHNEFLTTVQDPELVYYWRNVFPKLGGGKSIGSILTRLQDFFSQKALRNMVSQRDNKLDFADIMDSSKIFLAKLSEGLGGAENSYLLGTLLVSKFQQLAMARQEQMAALRKDFWMYVDEFDHFISPSMAEILKGLRKYRFGLTLAHQELHQLRDDPKVESAVMAHPWTRIVFRVSDDDAKKLGEGFTGFDAKSLKTLEKFHAIARVERNDFDFNLALRKPEIEAISDPQAVIAASRARYATPRSELEAALLANYQERSKPSKTVSQKEVVAPSRIAEKQAPTKIEIQKPVTVSKIETTENPRDTGSGKQTTIVSNLKEIGRGGSQHISIQKRLQAEAWKLGFRADKEKQLEKQSNAAADLVLLKGHLKIAVEIGITSSVDHEFENVQKCLNNGFERVAVIAIGRKRLEEMAAAVQAGLGLAATTKVGYYTPDEFLAELQKLAKTVDEPPPSAPMAKTGKVLGFEVTRNFPKQSPEEQRLNQQAIFEVTMQAMKT